MIDHGRLCNLPTLDTVRTVRTVRTVGTVANIVKAVLLLKSREVVGGGFVERVVWRLPASVPGSAHGLKYRLAFVVGGRCVVRYDNEAGKGDHRHIGVAEAP